MRSRTLSIVIPTRKKCRSLMRTLASLERIDPADAEFEVIVVDDASNDETDRWLGSYRPGFPLQRLRNVRQHGPASARNRGSRRASGEILLFLDDDMECDPELVEAHMTYHRCGEDVAVVGRTLYHPELRRSALTRYFDAQNLRQASSLCPPARFASNNLSLSRSLFERVGLFDEAFTCVGLEDVELGMRLARIPGCVLRYEQRACAYHYHDQSLRDYMRKVEAAGTRNLGVLASKCRAEVGTGALSWLVSGPRDGWVKTAARALLSIPGIARVLIPLAEVTPGDMLNRLLVKYLLASSMLRGYRRSRAGLPRSLAMDGSSMAEDLTVLIANLGRLEHLRPCLKSLFDTAGSKTSFRVIVGFNFPGENENPRALASEFPQVEQLRAPAKLGYCRAYNQLMARSTGRYALLLDDDTVLRPGTIDGMVRFMDSHPEVGIAGCRTVNPDGSYQKTTALMFSMATEMTNALRPAAFWDDGIDESVTTWKPVGWLNAHFLIVRAEVIKEVGVLDEYFYTFQCEADWCLRIRRAGWQVAYVPEFEIMHIGGAHSVASSVKSYSNLIRGHINRYYFMRKHYGNAAVHLFRLIMTLGATVRLLKYVAVWLVSPDRRPEAGPKVAAYGKIVLLGAASHPEDLPDDLRRESSDIDFVPARHPDVQDPGWGWGQHR